MWNAVGCLFYLGCQWVTTVIVVLFSSDYNNSGILAFAMSIGNMFASLSLYKIRTYQVSDIKNRFSGSDYVGFRLFTIAASFALVSLYLAIITRNIPMIIATLFYMLFKADETFVDVLYGIDQKNGRMDYIAMSQVIRGLATIIGFGVPLYLTGDLLPAIIGMTLLCAANTMLWDVRHSLRFESIKPHLSKSKLMDLAKACLLPTIANLCATSIVSVVRQKYGIMEGSEMLGIYASIATPAVLIQAGSTYLYSPLIGTLANALINKGGASFRHEFAKVTLSLIIVILIIVGGFSLFGGKLLITVYGDTIAPHIWIFIPVLLATTSIALLLYINDVLLILRDGVTQLAINAFALVLVTLFSGSIIDAFGMNGVNIAIIGGCLPAMLIGTRRILLSCKRA